MLLRDTLEMVLKQNPRCTTIANLRVHIARKAAAQEAYVRRKGGRPLVEFSDL